MENDWNAVKSSKPEGDLSRHVLIWHVFLECWTDIAENYAGNQFYTHWKELPQTGWIRACDRLPTDMDADFMNCVLAANDDLTVISVTGWHQLNGSAVYTQWMPTPQGPPEYKELKMLY